MDRSLWVSGTRGHSQRCLCSLKGAWLERGQGKQWAWSWSWRSGKGWGQREPGKVRLLGKGPAGNSLARRWFPGPAHPLPITCCGSHLPGRLQVAPALCSCSRRRGFERADSEYTDKLQHYTSGHSTYTSAGPAPWDPSLVSSAATSPASFVFLLPCCSQTWACCSFCLEHSPLSCPG